MSPEEPGAAVIARRPCARGGPDAFEEIGEAGLGVAPGAADHRHAPLGEDRLLHRIGARHEDEGARAILLVAGQAPCPPQLVHQQPYVHVAHAVADEEHRLAERVGAKLDVERGIERQAIEVIGFGDHEQFIVVEIPVELDDLSDALAHLGDVAGVGDFHVVASARLERGLDVAVVVRRVDDREIERDDELMQSRLAHLVFRDAPGAVHPAAQRADAAVANAVVFREVLVGAAGARQYVFRELQLGREMTDEFAP